MNLWLMNSLKKLYILMLSVGLLDSGLERIWDDSALKWKWMLLLMPFDLFGWEILNAGWVRDRRVSLLTWSAWAGGSLKRSIPPCMCVYVDVSVHVLHCETVSQREKINEAAVPGTRLYTNAHIAQASLSPGVSIMPHLPMLYAVLKVLVSSHVKDKTPLQNNVSHSWSISSAFVLLSSLCPVSMLRLFCTLTCPMSHDPIVTSCDNGIMWHGINVLPFAVTKLFFSFIKMAKL